MARQERIELAIPDAVGAGAPQVVDRHRDKTLLLTAANLNGGNVNVLGSLDGTDFLQIGATVSAPGFVNIVETVAQLRIDRATGSSTGQVADLLAFDERTQ